MFTEVLDYSVCVYVFLWLLVTVQIERGVCVVILVRPMLYCNYVKKPDCLSIASGVKC